MRTWILYLFLVLAVITSLFARFYGNFVGDVFLIEWMQDHQNSALTDAMEAVSLVGKSEIMLTLAAVLAGSMIALRRYREGYTATGALIFMLFLPLLKLMIDRPRPPVELVGIVDHPGDPGFPSGHTFHSIIIFGYLIFLAAVFIRKRWLRISAQMLLGLIIVAISISRVYLGKHWPSDVLGSYVIGGFFLILLIWAYNRKELPWRWKSRQFLSKGD